MIQYHLKTCIELFNLLLDNLDNNYIIKIEVPKQDIPVILKSISIHLDYVWDKRNEGHNTNWIEVLNLVQIILNREINKDTNFNKSQYQGFIEMLQLLLKFDKLNHAQVDKIFQNCYIDDLNPWEGLVYG